MIKYKMTFSDIESARRTFCNYNSCSCCLINEVRNGTGETCADYCKSHPHEAAAIMGLEIVEVRLKLTDRERALCKALGAKYVSMDGNKPNSPFEVVDVKLWEDKPEYSDKGQSWQHNGFTRGVGVLDARLFPSLQPGELAEVAEDKA